MRLGYGRTTREETGYARCPNGHRTRATIRREMRRGRSYRPGTSRSYMREVRVVDPERCPECGQRLEEEGRS